jgi:antitoxin YefM
MAMKKSSAREITVREFQRNLKAVVDSAIENHTPLRVTRRLGQDFMVIGAQDWESEQETLYILQNKSLMEQIDRSLRSHR